MSDQSTLNTIYQTANLLGVAESQYAFSHLCGRKQSWYSCAKASNRHMTIAAMVSLAVNIEKMLNEGSLRNHRAKVREFQKMLWKMVEIESVRRTSRF